MEFKLRIKKEARKELDRVPINIRRRIEEKIAELVTDPKGYGDKMNGFESRYKFRQGNYRVIYEVDDDQVIVIIVKIGTRGDVYKAGGG